jgi:hypothetical protein
MKLVFGLRPIIMELQETKSSNNISKYLVCHVLWMNHFLFVYITLVHMQDKQLQKYKAKSFEVQGEAKL